MIRTLRFICLGLLGTVGLILLIVFTIFMYDKETNPYVVYWESHFHAPTRPFLQEALKRIPSKPSHPRALVLAADVAQNDLSLFLQKGYVLTLIDQGLIYYDLFLPKGGENSTLIKDLDTASLPTFSLITASAILPFYDASAFHDIWYKIDRHLEKGGYFIGTFLGPQTTLFGDHEKGTMTYLTKEEITTLLKGYEVLLWEEHLHSWQNPKGIEERFDVLARKIS